MWTIRLTVLTRSPSVRDRRTDGRTRAVVSEDAGKSTMSLVSPPGEHETVRDRGLVPKDHQQEMAYGKSNGHVTDDVT